jgi:hypothetical protein
VGLGIPSLGKIEASELFPTTLLVSTNPYLVCGAQYVAKANQAQVIFYESSTFYL